MTTPITPASLDQLFGTARSYNGWTDTPVADQLIQRVYELAALGPTSANCSPARFVFVTSEDSKAKLAAMALPTNSPKILAAPCTVIIGQDLDFMDLIPELFPHNPGAQNWFPKGSEIAQLTAFRNATLQGAYLMMAARSMGLDCGPMSGFSNAAVDEAFFAGTSIKSNFICCLGEGDRASIFERSPRLAFDRACKIV